MPSRFHEQREQRPGPLKVEGRREGSRVVTHRVRIFGMWLKLVTRMRLMLLLLRVLQKQRENVMNEGPRDVHRRGGRTYVAVKKKKIQQVRTGTAKYLETGGNSADDGESTVLLFT